MRSTNPIRTHIPFIVWGLLASGSALQAAQPDKFTATTVNMTPAGTALRIDVIDWPDDAARTSIVSVLAGGPDDSGTVSELPTVGYVWPSGSSVGYALKYAHRAMTADGGERITVVTDRPIGAYSFEPWQANGGETSDAQTYSVIELSFDSEGNGRGTMSLAAEVSFDQDLHTVFLDRDASRQDVLTDVRREPKPYWTQGGG